jgi:polyisoprenoid-binding protein YceI
MRKISTLLLIIVCGLFSAFTFIIGGGSIYSGNKGSMKINSNGASGKINAESKQLTGTLDVTNRTFNMTIPIVSFEGFKSPLQKKHFNEKYMETEKIPGASFKGKIIEEVNFEVDGTYNVRAKGIMKIHGTEKETIVKSKIVIKGGLLNLESSFSILLKDFNIKIPTIIMQKIAEEIFIDVKMDMSPQK